MKIADIVSEKWLKQAVYHTLGKISAEDIVNGAEFTYKSPMRFIGPGGSEKTNIPIRVRVVDEKGDKAGFVNIQPDGSVVDVRTKTMSFHDLYDGDDEKMKARLSKLPKSPREIEYKSNLARFLNDNGGKRVK